MQKLLLAGCISCLAAIGQNTRGSCAPDSLIEMPSNVSVFADATPPIIHIQNGAKSVDLTVPTVGKLRQACRLANGRLMLVGDEYGVAIIVIVAPIEAAIIDQFWSYSPELSPDRRWIALRRFYAPHGNAIGLTEQYFVYDTQKTARENHHPEYGTTLSEMDAVGQEIYPIEEPAFPNANLPEDELHFIRSPAFFWSPDSTALVFADWHQNRFSIVLTVIRDTQTKTYLHSVSYADVCGSNNEKVDLSISDARVRRHSSGELEIIAEFHTYPACQTKPLRLTLDDFSPAPPEKHQPLPEKRKAIMIERK